MNLSDEAVAALARAVRIDAQEIARRKEFLKFDETDVSLLTGLQNVSRRFVDDFYAHMLKFGETSRFIPDTSSLERLKRTQTDYFDSLNTFVPCGSPSFVCLISSSANDWNGGTQQKIVRFKLLRAPCGKIAGKYK